MGYKISIFGLSDGPRKIPNQPIKVVHGLFKTIKPNGVRTYWSFKQKKSGKRKTHEQNVVYYINPKLIII